MKCKKKLTLTINGDLLKQARQHDINISSFLTIKLQEHIAQIEGNNTQQKNNNSPERIRTAGAGSKGQRVNRYTTGLS